MRIQLGPSKQRKATQEESQEDMEVHCVTLVGPRTEKALDKNHRNLNEDTWKFYIVPFSAFCKSKVLNNDNNNNNNTLQHWGGWGRVTWVSGQPDSTAWSCFKTQGLGIQLNDRAPACGKHYLFVFNCVVVISRQILIQILDSTFLIIHIVKVNLRKTPSSFFQC